MAGEKERVRLFNNNGMASDAGKEFGKEVMRPAINAIYEKASELNLDIPDVTASLGFIINMAHAQVNMHRIIKEMKAEEDEGVP
jgi:hypothetical protein